MYTGLLHSHKLVVTLFLLIYLIKTVLLFLGKNDALDSFSKKTKIAEMIISTLFLLTGAALLFQVAEIKTLFYVKLACVFGSIPLAVVGFRKKNKALAALSFLMIVAGYGLAEMSKRKVDKKEVDTAVVTDPTSGSYDINAHGKALFAANCAVCHGEDGTKGLSGAKNLQTSQLSDEEAVAVIAKGKGAMAAYEAVLTAQEIEAVKAYAKSLRK